LSETFIYIIGALIIGLALGFLLLKAVFSRQVKTLEDRVKKQESESEELIKLKSEIHFTEKELGAVSQKLTDKDIELKSLISELTACKTRENFQQALILKKEKELVEHQLQFRTDFENLANKILRQTTSDFSQSNQKQIGELLAPLKEQMLGFEKRVNEVHSSDTKNRSELMGQVKALMHLNTQIREEATNLTQALRGDTKQQGAWGEFILEKVLESSGLVKGQEYETQVFVRDEEGSFKPDVVVNLPDDKCIIIDSKVSLKAFDLYVNEQDRALQKTYLTQHVASVRQHVKSLSSKNYHQKVKGQSVDFVLMFLPVEAGFAEALKTDLSLYNYAWENGIVIVSPTTLLATLRTVASVWKQEKQNRNVVQIAEESGKLYDKFVGFIADFEKIKRGLDSTQSAYEGAFRKLKSGNGNLISKAEKIKALGAKTSKEIDNSLIESNDED
jgi:DNA recombination protein RmuC